MATEPEERTVMRQFCVDRPENLDDDIHTTHAHSVLPHKNTPTEGHIQHTHRYTLLDFIKSLNVNRKKGVGLEGQYYTYVIYKHKLYTTSNTQRFV